MMSHSYHQSMRTTMTLDDDVAAKLRAEARRSGRPFREVVNDMIRRGLMSKQQKSPAGPFRVFARDLGRLRPGYNLDNIGDLLERLEGALHR
jgi:hypothetical protein